MQFEAKCRFIRAAVMRYGFTESSFWSEGSPDIESDIEALNENLDTQLWINLKYDERMDVAGTRDDINRLLDEMEDVIREAADEVWERYLEKEDITDRREMCKRIMNRFNELSQYTWEDEVEHFDMMVSIVGWYKDRYPHFFN